MDDIDALTETVIDALPPLDASSVQGTLIGLAAADRETRIRRLVSFLAKRGLAVGASKAAISEMVRVYVAAASRNRDAGWWLAHSPDPIEPWARDIQAAFTAEERARLAACRNL